MGKRAWVAGATGYTGREVVHELRRRGFEVIAHVRPDSPRRDEWQARFATEGAQVSTTPWQPEAQRHALAEAQPTVVFALLGTTQARARALSREGKDPAAASYRQVDYGLTALLLDAVRASCPEARFVYLSALGVRPDPAGGDGYMGVRARMEAELRDSDQPHVIARPGFISGSDREESRPLERLAARTSDAVLDALGALGAERARERWHSLTGTELARALVSLALDPAAAGTVADPAQLRARAAGASSSQTVAR